MSDIKKCFCFLCGRSTEHTYVRGPHKDGWFCCVCGHRRRKAPAPPQGVDTLNKMLYNRGERKERC